MRGKSNVIKRNVKKVWGACYTLGARYLPKNTVLSVHANQKVFDKGFWILIQFSGERVPRHPEERSDAEAQFGIN
jgi:hypothetical protein